MPLQQLPLGPTDLLVSQLAFGCMSLTAERERDGLDAVKQAFDLGITFYDTADVYGRGDSEQLLGKALTTHGIARDSVTIASKCGIVFQGMDDRYTYKAYDLSKDYLKRSCEASLKRLGTDYLDLYQPHRIDYLTHPAETAAALDELKAEGKIRHAGASNYTVAELRALASYADLVSLQTQFSLLHLEPLETGLLPVCQEKRLSLLAWSPLGRGLLAGGKQAPHDDWQRQREAGVVAQLQPFADRYACTTGQLALAWLMQLPGGVIPLVGTANPQHITEAVEAASLTLERDDWYELMVIARGRPMPWYQRPYAYIEQT